MESIKPITTQQDTQHFTNELTSGSHLKPHQVMHCDAPATCGEFVQGYINDRPFLINCPIDLYSRASVKSTKQTGLHVKLPEQYQKISQALALMESKVMQQTGLEVSIDSNIPRGKGLASSSADLAAAIFAVSKALGHRLSAKEMSALIAQIEPSDSVHLPGISEVNHMTSEHIWSLPAPDNLSVLIVDCGGAIDTLDIDRERARAYYQRKQSKIAAAASLMQFGLRHNKPWAIAEAATASAKLSQHILPKPIFPELLETVIEAGALGLNCAHSGTVCGVLYKTSDDLAPQLTQLIESRFGRDGQVLSSHRIISGGCHAK